MSNTVTGKIKEFVVDDDEHKAHILMAAGTTVSGGGAPYNNEPLRLTDDHDTAFNAMASACAAAGTGTTAKKVILTFDGNFPSDTEIDRIAVQES
jgi:hypothetical protein